MLYNFRKKYTVLGEKTYKEAVTRKTNTHTNNIAILGDNIIIINRGKKSEFKKTLISRQARFKHFPRASSKHLLDYIDLTLEEQNFEAAIIDTGINDVLYDSIYLLKISMKQGKSARAIVLNMFLSQA